MKRAEFWFYTFPLWYAIHELEELLGFTSWKKNTLPHLPENVQNLFQPVSFAKFSKAIIFETLLILGVWIEWWSPENHFWFVITIVFTSHFLSRIIQSILFRKASLWLNSSIVLLPVCVFFIIESFPYVVWDSFIQELLLAIGLMLLFFWGLFSFFKST